VENILVTSREDLVRLVDIHQDLLLDDQIVAVVEGIPSEFKDELETKFLVAVAFYHRQLGTRRMKWGSSHQHFEHLAENNQCLSMSPLLSCYINIYAFLSGDKAGMNLPGIITYFYGAKEDADQLPEPRKSQVLGFLYYNLARIYHKRVEMDEARWNWGMAGRHSASYYNQIKENGSEAAVKAAATQVWKIRSEWGNFFPDAHVSQCLVDDILFEEVAKLADQSWAAKPS
jgi:hypothetical protein